MNSGLLMNLIPRRMTAFTVLALAAITASASAAGITVVNGGFEQTLKPGSSQFGSGFPSQQVTGWTTSGFNFVFTPGSADTTGASSQFGNLTLWGPGNGSNNGLGASPNGGNYLGLDGAFKVGAISQVISGLTVGRSVTVNFSFAGAQQHGFSGVTSEAFTVSLGNESHSTPVLTDLNHGFTGWKSESLTFTPTATSETLSFLAVGTPNGEPPFSLLDGVSISQTPEPASLALLATGLVGIGGLVRRRSKPSTN